LEIEAGYIKASVPLNIYAMAGQSDNNNDNNDINNNNDI